jgi:hypothetical protein
MVAIVSEGGLALPAVAAPKTTIADTHAHVAMAALTLAKRGVLRCPGEAHPCPELAASDPTMTPAPFLRAADTVIPIGVSPPLNHVV